MREKNIDILKFYEHQKIQNYILKYIEELRLHFTLEQKDLERILLECYNSVKEPTPVEKFMVKLFNRV